MEHCTTFVISGLMNQPSFLHKILPNSIGHFTKFCSSPWPSLCE